MSVWQVVNRVRSRTCRHGDSLHARGIEGPGDVLLVLEEAWTDTHVLWKEEPWLMDFPIHILQLMLDRGLVRVTQKTLEGTVSETLWGPEQRFLYTLEFVSDSAQKRQERTTDAQK